jgi:hypothetical protein
VLTRRVQTGRVIFNSPITRLHVGQGTDGQISPRKYATYNPAVTPKRLKVDAMRNPTLFEMEKLEDAGRPPIRSRLIETMESNKPNFAKEYFVDKAVDEAAFILERIDRKWPVESVKVL